MVSRRNEVVELELGVSVQILTHSLSHSVAWIARLIAPKHLQFLLRLVRGMSPSDWRTRLPLQIG